jgi:hypothetical protein
LSVGADDGEGDGDAVKGAVALDGAPPAGPPAAARSPGEPRDAVASAEHERLRWVPLGEIDALRMPQGYRNSINAWEAST